MSAWTPQQKRLLRWIVILYLLIGLIYAWVTPPLESSDEYKHYPVVQHIQTTGQLVVLDPAEPGRWLQEGAQPPLYYLIMAAVTYGIDTSDLPEIHDINPHAYVGNGAQLHNKNLIIHDPEREAWPWSGSILAIMIIRVVSIGLGIGTIWFAARLGTTLFGPQIGLLAAVLTAFNPMFLFISAAVNNDSLSALLGAAGLWLLVHFWVEPPEPDRQWTHYLILGLVCGAGILTKLSLGGMLLLAGVVTGLKAWQTGRWGILFRGGLLTFVTAMTIAGWWLIRNWQLYGDLTGLTPFVAVQGTRDLPTIAGVDWWGEFGTFFRSYWGLFGGVNILAPQWFYWVCNLLVLAALLGWGWRLWRRQENPAGLWLPAAWGALLFVLLIRWNIISPAFQGRLIFPALTGLNVLMAAGLWPWRARLRPQRADQRWISLPAASGVWFLVMAVTLPFMVIAPDYQFPEPARVPTGKAFGPITFIGRAGEPITLVGVDVAPGQSVTAGSGEWVDVTLYWGTTDLVTRRMVSSVHLLGRELESVGQVDRYPGLGMWPTDRWQRGQIWADPYRIFVKPGAEAPARLLLSLSMIDSTSGELLTPRDNARNELDLVIVGEARLGSQTAIEAEPNTPLTVDLADFVTFRGYDHMIATNNAGETVIDLTLHWQANGTPSLPYTVFVQLLDTDGAYLTGADSPPLQGDYPTDLWRVGDQIVDAYQLVIPTDAPAGPYQIAVGLYDPVSGARMSRLDGGDAIIWPLAIDSD